MNPNAAKWCSKCKRFLSRQAFYRQASHSDGYRSQCKECEHGGGDVLPAVPRMGPMSVKAILAPGPGDWSLDECLRISEARNAAIITNGYSGFPRQRVAA